MTSLKSPLLCYRKTQPFILQKRTLVSVVFDPKCEWWLVSTILNGEPVTLTTTETPHV